MQVAKDDVECPVCVTLMFEAWNNECGHSLCGECIHKVNNCPQCRKPLRWSPNITLRRIIEKQFPNEYRTYMELKDPSTMEEVKEKLTKRHGLEICHIWADDEFAFVCLKAVYKVIRTTREIMRFPEEPSLPFRTSALVFIDACGRGNLFEMEKWNMNMVGCSAICEETKKRWVFLFWGPKTHKRKRIEIINDRFAVGPPRQPNEPTRQLIVIPDEPPHASVV